MTPGDFVPLSRTSFQPSAAVVAPRLLGHLLVRNTSDGVMVAVIVETEAYLVGDPACHGFPGETRRNRSMYGPPGHAYVYFIYGNYWCVNAVCCPKGCAEAVLIRAVEPITGIESMRRRRPVKQEADLANGPAKLCTAMSIDRALDAAGSEPADVVVEFEEDGALVHARRLDRGRNSSGGAPIDADIDLDDVGRAE